jgi:hypothetical protein
MDVIRNLQLGQAEPYGVLPGDFRYDVRAGYTAVVGQNNAGKSTLLQFVFRALAADPEFGQQRICLILPDRSYVDVSTETAGRTLDAWNGDLRAHLQGQPLTFHAEAGPRRAELTKLLLHGDFLAQMARINDLLPQFGLPPIRLAGPQQVQFEQIVVHLQGSGLRAVLPILAAVTNDSLDALLVDEPELALEPRLQKALRDLLVKTAETKRVVMIATHSHLLINRDVPESTQSVLRRDGSPYVDTVDDPARLFDITFDLLGASTEDLFFPRNYVIVEGASDQVILSRVLELLGEPGSRIKVLSAQGISEVRQRASSVVRALVPLIINESPYAGRVVALIDEPRATDSASAEKLSADLEDRLYVLDKPTIEEYLPDDLYVRAERVKADDLAELARLIGNPSQRRDLKKAISDSIAAVLSVEDLDSIPTIHAAAKRAISL